MLGQKLVLDLEVFKGIADMDGASIVLGEAFEKAFDNIAEEYDSSRQKQSQKLEERAGAEAGPSYGRGVKGCVPRRLLWRSENI